MVAADGEAPEWLGTGDVAVVRGPQPYVVADHPDTPPGIVIEPGQRCTTTGGDDVRESMVHGVRTWGNSPTGSTMLLTGTYPSAGQVSRRLLDALPALLVLRRATWDCPFVALLAAELGEEGPGQTAVLD